MKMGALLLAVLALGACQDEPPPEWQEVAEQAANRRTAERAEALYDSTAYDTVSWRGSYSRGERGRVVFDHSCADCHGEDGRGGGPLAVEEGLEVGSLVASGWVYDGDVPALRRRIFTGHGPGMPAWGLTELSPRDVDAVAYFVDERLPERAGGEEP
ncbi:MAG: c-type cytochrome [Gemmatimonadota bacterium]